MTEIIKTTTKNILPDVLKMAFFNKKSFREWIYNAKVNEDDDFLTLLLYHSNFLFGTIQLDKKSEAFNVEGNILMKPEFEEIIINFIKSVGGKINSIMTNM